MTTNQTFLSRSASQRFTLYACVWSGAGLMALIGMGINQDAGNIVLGLLGMANEDNNNSEQSFSEQTNTLPKFLGVEVDHHSPRPQVHQSQSANAIPHCTNHKLPSHAGSDGYTETTMARASALDLFGLMQSGASRLQHTVNQHLNLLSTSATTSPAGTIFDQVTVSPSCSFRSTFVHNSAGENDATSKASHDVSDASCEGHLQALSIDGVALLIVSFLDGESLARVQGVNIAWRAFIKQYREPLYRSLMEERRVFHTVITSTSAFKSYLFSLRHELDRELAHTHAVHPTHQALEQYCASTEQHGFVAMFCDIIEFRDPRIARFVAWKRQSALSMVLAATPDHVMKFRKRSSYVGPITFVPVDNPLWPVFTSSPVDAPGFMGYAFDHVTMVQGYEELKNTVVKSILKELMIFDTPENAAAYGRRIGRAPYAAILEDEDAQIQVGQAERTSHLTFSSPLRRQLSKYPVAKRINCLRAKIKAVDDCIATTPNSNLNPSFIPA
ncbi:unnamed protein product [Phytophthora lilii]|uniref:Unnamed protein product n=1 Tax=Phytophthora lilii TaxID=2077276 RepID=A0A9W6WRF7_9STRA|nr:unnamed protein product [Phytophthora lilii]